MKEHFTLRYSSTETDSGDSIMDLELNFDNPSENTLIARLNTWLIAIGRENLQVYIDAKSTSLISKTVIKID